MGVFRRKTTIDIHQRRTNKCIGEAQSKARRRVPTRLWVGLAALG
jgi:hypothetical protein